MRVLRTPDERLVELPDFAREPGYVTIGAGLRMAFVEAGPSDGEPILLLHGEPTWSFLYRSVIASLAEHGLRAIAPDLVGFGRSDKPTSTADHSYARHVDWVREFVFDALGLTDVTLVGHDWGGLIGLRLAMENSERVVRLVATNTGPPTGDGDPITGGVAPVLMRVVPGARLATIPGAGHFVQEDAGDRLAEEIVRFVDETPP